eukprot:6028576-Lingulodinium_polyedra.AAC.1
MKEAGKVIEHEQCKALIMAAEAARQWQVEMVPQVLSGELTRHFKVLADEDYVEYIPKKSLMLFSQKLATEHFMAEQYEDWAGITFPFQETKPDWSTDSPYFA